MGVPEESMKGISESVERDIVGLLDGIPKGHDGVLSDIHKCKPPDPKAWKVSIWTCSCGARYRREPVYEWNPVGQEKSVLVSGWCENCGHGKIIHTNGLFNCVDTRCRCGKYIPGDDSDLAD